MAVKIRMTRMGRRHRPFFRINVVDSRNPRDGRIIEKLGYYDPLVKDPEKQVVLDLDRARYWLDNGAIPSDTVSQMLLRLGVRHKYAEQKAARREKARAVAKAKGRFFTKAQKIAAEKAAQDAEKAKADAEKAKAEAEKAKADAEKAKVEAEKAAEKAPEPKPEEKPAQKPLEPKPAEQEPAEQAPEPAPQQEPTTPPKPEEKPAAGSEQGPPEEPEPQDKPQEQAEPEDKPQEKPEPETPAEQHKSEAEEKKQ